MPEAIEQISIFAAVKDFAHIVCEERLIESVGYRVGCNPDREMQVYDIYVAGPPIDFNPNGKGSKGYTKLGEESFRLQERFPGATCIFHMIQRNQLQAEGEKGDIVLGFTQNTP